MEGEQPEYECEHDSPNATFYYSDGGPQGDAEFSYTICSCGADDTEGDFETEWVRTDAWRGYGVVRPTKGSRWVEVHDDNILSMSEDAERLAAFDTFLRSAMEEAGIDYVRAFATSSNLFSTGYTLFVEKAKAKRVQRLIKEVKPRYRDDSRYFETAITGKDPKDMGPTDRTFAVLAAAILSGKK